MSEDRMAEGVEHLQAAALEVIAAARAFLDVAEDLVTDPDRVSSTLATVATLVDGGKRPPRQRPPASTADGEDAGEPDESPGLRRIDLS